MEEESKPVEIITSKNKGSFERMLNEKVRNGLIPKWETFRYVDGIEWKYLIMLFKSQENKLDKIGNKVSNFMWG